MLSNNHDDDYIGFKLRARYTLPRLGGYKKMCHQRGGLRPHQQEKTPTTSTQLHHSLSLDLELDRAPPTSCVYTHEYLLTYSRTVVWPMAVPYSQSRTWCGPWPYRILKTSSRTSLRMNAQACTPRAEFSDPESTALHSQKYRSSKFPDRQSIRKLHTTSLHRPRCTSPT